MGHDRKNGAHNPSSFRWLRHSCRASRSDRWGRVALVILLALLLGPVTSWAEPPDVAAERYPVSRLLLQKWDDRLPQGLGQPLCTAASASGSVTSYLFETGEGLYTWIGVEAAPWAADYLLITSVTVTSDRSKTAECPLARHASNLQRPILPEQFYQGIRIGDRLDTVIGRLGSPRSSVAQGGDLILTYERERDHEHIEEWTMRFTDQHLTGWNVNALKVFFELSG